MHRPLAVILGAGPGIGLSAGLRFAREGFRVALVSRPGDPLEAFREALGGALVLGVELDREAPLREALATLETWGGFPRALVLDLAYFFFLHSLQNGT